MQVPDIYRIEHGRQLLELRVAGPGTGPLITGFRIQICHLQALFDCASEHQETRLGTDAFPIISLGRGTSYRLIWLIYGSAKLTSSAAMDP